MRVSVLIACWNAEKYLGEALRSVLDQDPAPDEVILIDDGSTDRSANVAAGFADVELLRQPNRGVAAALNTAAARASGDLFAFIDADDLWAAGKSKAQLEMLRADPHLDGVFGHLQAFASPDLSEQDRRAVRINEASTPGLVKGTLMIRRAAFERVGLFDEARRYADFVDWYARACTLDFRWAMLPETVYRRRIHSDNLGRRESKAQAEQYLLTMRTLIERRRADRDSVS